MKMNGLTLESRGKENVFLGNREIKRTVYKHPTKWCFYIRNSDGIFFEVYHRTDYFSVIPQGAIKIDEGIEKTKIRAYYDDMDEWAWVFLFAGSLYIRYYGHWYGRIEDFNINRIEVENL